MIPHHEGNNLSDQDPQFAQLPAHSQFRENQNSLAGQVSQASKGHHLHGKGARLCTYFHDHEIPDS